MEKPATRRVKCIHEWTRSSMDDKPLRMGCNICTNRVDMQLISVFEHINALCQQAIRSALRCLWGFVKRPVTKHLLSWNRTSLHHFLFDVPCMRRREDITTPGWNSYCIPGCGQMATALTNYLCLLEYPRPEWKCIFSRSQVFCLLITPCNDNKTMKKKRR